MSETQISVSGMTCNHCRMAVENAVKSVSGVKSVSVDLGSGKVKYEHDNADAGAVKSAIEDAGYTVTQ